LRLLHCRETNILNGGKNRGDVSRNPLKRFNDSLEGVNERVKRRFYRDNFIDMMGAGLDPALHDIPGLAAA
jgi:hypothetical protein